MSAVTDPPASLIQYKELIDFLYHKRVDVCAEALKAVRDLSGDPQFLATLSAAPDSETENGEVLDALVRGLLRHVGRRSDASPAASTAKSSLSYLSASAMVNLSGVQAVAEALLKLDATRRLVEDLREQHRGVVDSSRCHPSLNLMVLSNLTRLPVGRDQFLQKHRKGGGPSSADYRIGTLSEMMIQRMIHDFSQRPMSSGDEDSYLYAGHVLVNLSSDPDVGTQCFGQTVEEVAACLSELSKFLLRDSYTLESSRRDAFLQRRLTVLRILRNVAVGAPSFLEDLLLERDSGKGGCVIGGILPRLCCLLYPPPGPLRNAQSGTPKSLICGSMISEKGALCGTSGKPGTTPSPRLKRDASPSRATTADGSSSPPRSVPQYISEHAFGPVEDLESRVLAAQVFSSLGASRFGREAMRKCEVYEVLRVWHLWEKDLEIRSLIENMVHLLVYTEQELQEQDQQIKMVD